ncbi:uncharacterized protein LOC119111688 [Pollicipes pollicipes]|uniref:uncharacterized protein LOC119111688 n=1 Tax=Pollicipes pollicipes TaxID=41117 RepID=UPI001884FE51|nr:uncharacterized protein LOC119111688 [Pollicipes pollicipes]
MSPTRVLHVNTPLIMECSVEELSEVQLRHFNTAKKTYQDAIKKANRLLLSQPTPAVVPPPPSPPPPPPAAVDSSGDEAMPSAPSPSPPSPVPLPVMATAQVPRPVPSRALPLAESSPFTGANLSSEIPPPQRISLSTPQPLEKRVAVRTASIPTSAPEQPAAASQPDAEVTIAEEVPAASARRASVDIPVHEMQVKTYPALHVQLRTPYSLTPASKTNYPSRRSQLDIRVKRVLLHTPSQFTEWLIQVRLVRAVQFCPTHRVTWSGQPRQLRLGMFTDSDKLSQSGGYVWVKNCCRPKYLSVHYGSLFDVTRLLLPTTAPVQVLKLMYHWSCQTPLHNVTQWLKLRPMLVDEVFGLLRAVCMLKMEEPVPKLGGSGHTVQVGLVSLGTSGPDGVNKNVKVEVLGVKDESSGEIRLVGFEPRIKNRIRAVVGAVQDWVHHDSSLLLDHSISPLPFRNNFRAVTNAPSLSKDTSGNIMHFLRRTMPRMFQMSLVYLPAAVICQFIAEITWREKYGRDPNSTFGNLIAHLGHVTQQCEGSLIEMLKKVLVSPSMDLKRKPRKQTLASRPDSQPESATAVG